MSTKLFWSLALLLFVTAPAFSQRVPQANADPSAAQSAMPSGGRIARGAKRQIDFFERAYYPFGQRSAGANDSLWAELAALPGEAASERSAVPADWEYVGGYGAAAEGTKYSGRIVDIEYTAHGGLRMLSASGGLWKWIVVGFVPVAVPISDKLNTQWGGAFCTHPTNAEIIFLGTGEPQIKGGTGLWKTDNGGKSWSKVAISPTPAAFYKIAYHPTNANIMFAATDIGLFKSQDGGISWSRKRTGNVTDFVINPANPTKMFLSVWGDKFYKSTSTGNSWAGMTTGGAPTVDVGRAEIAVCPSSPNLMYAVVARNSNNTTLGIYKTEDGGATWLLTNFGSDFHWQQGFYGISLAVDPSNCNIVLAGGGTIRRTTDGWNFSDVDGKHADQHAMEFRPDGSYLYLGNDGGYFYSSDHGATFTGTTNVLPVSQFYSLSVGKNDPQRMGGGTQDNGMMYTKGPSYNWSAHHGDGSGFAVDPFSPDTMYATLSVYGSGPAAWNWRTYDGGQNWAIVNTGIPAGGEWFPVMRTDYWEPTYQYTERDGRVFSTTDNGANWFDISPGGAPFPADVWDLGISHGGFPNIYAALAVPSNALMVRDRTTGLWANRSTGLPTTGANGTYVRKAVPSPNPAQPDLAYAVMGGIPGGAPKKVFKTVNRGQNWTDITGNLPNVACTDVMPHPTDPNVLVLATESGPFRTDDGGATWYQWWEGIPRGIFMTDMDFVDSTVANGKFYVYASTYGRGIWRREMGAGFSPMETPDERAELPTAEAMPTFRLDQNQAHATGAPLTAIPFFVGKQARVRLSIFAENGQLVKILADREMPPGYHIEMLDLSDKPAGLYLYMMEAPGFVETKKLVALH